MRSEGFDGIDSSTTLGFARDQSHPLFQQPSTALEPPGLYSNVSAGFPAAIQQPHSLQFHTLSQSHILFALKCLPSCLAQASLSSVRSAPTAKFERHHAPSLNLQSVHVRTYLYRFLSLDLQYSRAPSHSKLAHLLSGLRDMYG